MPGNYFKTAWLWHSNSCQWYIINGKCNKNAILNQVSTLIQLLLSLSQKWVRLDKIMFHKQLDTIWGDRNTMYQVDNSMHLKLAGRMVAKQTKQFEKPGFLQITEMGQQTDSQTIFHFFCSSRSLRNASHNVYCMRYWMSMICILTPEHISAGYLLWYDWKWTNLKWPSSYLCVTHTFGPISSSR